VYEYSAAVMSVHDGDTVTLDIDLGLHVHHVGEHIRIAHINAPELKHADGTRARDRLIELLDDGPLIIHTERDRTEKYGRWLASITNASGIDVGTQLIKEGLAVKYEGGRR
jgi:micrococcal nuclease